MSSEPEKKQGLSQTSRKIILWSLMVVIAAGLICWWVSGFKKKLGDIGGEEFQKEINVDSLKDQFKDLPQFNVQE
ncbi:MAG: hypothetical protein WC514_02495 [Candidatus Paceibacterota bacterium]